MNFPKPLILVAACIACLSWPARLRAQTAFNNGLSTTNNGSVTVTLPAAIANNYTVCAWVNLRSGTAGLEPGSGLLSGGCDLTAEILLRGNTSGSPQNIELGRCNAFFGGLSSGTLAVNAWTHVAVSVSSGNVVSYYLNGTAAGAWNAGALPTSIGPSFTIGEGDGYRKFNGIIDDFQVWTNALSQAQIQTNLYRPLTGNEPGLYLYYKFDSSSGTVATNSATVTAGSYNGVLNLVSNSPGWVTSGIPSQVSCYTSNATSILTNGATLAGGVNPGGLTAGAWFEWGTTTNYGNRTVTTSLGNGTMVIAQTAVLGGLTPGAAYHFRIGASNSAGIVYGDNNTLIAGMTTVTTLADSGPGSLRNAIAAAGPGVTIDFATNGTIVLTSAELLINKNLNIVGPGATNLALSGNNARRVINVAGGTVSLSGVTVREGRSTNGANGTTFVGNPIPPITGQPGAGIYNGGTLNITNCCIANNQTGNGGNGAPPYGPGADGGPGAGIYNAGILRMHGCTVSSNVCGAGGSGWQSGAAGGSGGGLFNAASASVTIVASTFAGNSSGPGGAGADTSAFGIGSSGGPGGNGGAIQSDGPLTLIAGTVSGNQVGPGGRKGNQGGLGNDGAGGAAAGVINHSTFAIKSSIIALNLASGNPDVAGDFSSAGHNLIGRTNGSSGFGSSSDMVGLAAAPLDPLLGPLQFNGGPTLTMALLPGSRAIEGGDDAITGTDQRGFPRLNGQHVDSGAYEFDISALPPPTVANPGVSIGSPDPANGTRPVTFSAAINAGGVVTTVSVLFGTTPSYGGTNHFVLTDFPIAVLNSSFTVNGFAPGDQFHYRLTVNNARGAAATSDGTFFTPLRYAPGDANADGVVDQNEVNLVLSNYFTASPWLYMTNVLGLGESQVTFSLSNSIASVLSVEVSTNLMNWDFLASTAPRYLISDTNAPASPMRYYRLRWP
ncbi:MAG: hypothetical protein IT579_08085 [Verrucomicrobia subdivision 3 bacterium]|nr:hypothetical protein [Limisphaerales bacterium]